MTEVCRETVEVVSTHVGIWQAPTVEVPDDWPWPVLSLDNDRIVLHTVNGKPPRRIWPSFRELCGPSRSSVMLQLREILIALCLAAGFAGTAFVLVRSDIKVKGDKEEWVFCLDVAVVFTGWIDLVPAGEPMLTVDKVDMGEDDKWLRDAVLAHEVLES